MDKSVESLIMKADPEISALVRRAEERGTVNEIRFRRNRRIAFTVGEENYVTDRITTAAVMDSLFDLLCRGSVYAHMETIKNGYIILPGGVRAGVCGRAVTENGRIKNVYDIGSINIRLPHSVYGICGRLYDMIVKKDFYLNMLIYSVPGAGKTTMIRDLAYRLAAEGRRRVALIDSRCEIADMRLSLCDNVDILSAYPKCEAIEIATRTLNPQYIICDEIGSFDECQVLLSVQSAGVPVIATAHAANVLEIVRRKNTALLKERGFFDIYAGLKRYGQKVSLTFCTSEEVRSL